MTQEERELLLKDLCARLPYQPICEYTDTEDDFCTATGALGYSLCDFIAGKILIKPYLRPMDSMTEEENKEIEAIYQKWFLDGGGFGMYVEVIDWLRAHLFDYHGLIEKGLALKASKNMYK